MEGKYALIPDKETLELHTEEIDPKELKPNQIIVEAAETIISAGTELAAFYALTPGVYKKGSRNAYPWRPGYGLVGKIVSAGSGVKDFSPNERIFCFGNHSSLQAYNLDLTNSLPFYSAFKLADDIDNRSAVIARMGLIALAAPQVSEVKMGSKVVIFGLGFVGNLAAQLYQLQGAEVLAFDPVGMRCNVAKQTGINQVLSISPEEQIEAVMEFTDGKGADITVDAVGHSNVVTNCVKCTTNYGQIILLGSPRVETKGNLTEVFRTIHLKSMTMRGALEWRLPAYSGFIPQPSIQGNLNLLWRYINSGQLRVEPLITHVVKPERLGESYVGLMADKESYLGVIIDWQ